MRSTIKKSVHIIMLSSLVMMLVLSTPSVILAQSEFSFSVEPIFSENQIQETTSYFDLNIEPGESETFGILLNNFTDQPVEVEISAYTAYTNVNGVVEYGREPEEKNSTLTHALGDLLTTPGIVTIPSRSSIEAPIKITMPEESFTGLLAGGLRIQEVKEDNTSGEEGLAIENAFSYIIGVIASNNRAPVIPDLELLDVFASQLNYRNVFSATLQNYTPTFINQLEVEAEIRAVGQEEVLYEAQSSGMQMAPNSHFDFPIPLEGERFQAGDYVLSMVARSGEYEWSWEHEFTVDAQEARQFNRQDVEIGSGINVWIIILIGFIILLVAIIIYLLLKQKNKLSKEISTSKGEGDYEEKA